VQIGQSIGRQFAGNPISFVTIMFSTICRIVVSPIERAVDLPMDRDIYPIYNSNCACSGAEMVPLATRSADFTRSLKLPGTPTDTARCGCLRTASSLKQKQCSRLA
jgi:hypothetical protein